MFEFLLASLPDTNVLSETSRRQPNPDVYQFISESRNLWIPVIAIEEIQIGVELLPRGRRREQFADWLTRTLLTFENKFLQVGLREAHLSGRFRALAKRSGYELTHGDSLIAATAATNGLCLATRNIKDFELLGVDLLNPWD